MSSSPTSSSSSSPIASEPDPLASMRDVKCFVDFIIGTGRVTVRDCLRLEPHMVMRLDQPAGADMELRVQGVSMAVGEVVIIDDSTALRVSRILAPVGVEAA